MVYQKVEQRTPLVVIGAGVAGCAAATEAAKAGVEVTLIDENPIEMSMMGLDVPLYFGQRILPTAADRGVMMERVVQSNPGLVEAEEAGVDIQLGIYCWGAFRNTRNVRMLDGPQVGLADTERSWILGYERLIVAAGARDLGMGFTGWQFAGGMGAGGAHSLMTRYQALTAQNIVVLGSGNLGLNTAKMAVDRGITVSGVVEVASTVQGDDALRAELEGKGVTFYTSHTIKEARSATDDIESVVLVGLDDSGQVVDGSETEIACDSVVLAIGMVPTVELPALLQCELAFDSTRGGWAPVVDEWMRSSVDNVFIAGDAAGFNDGMVANPAIAEAQGRIAGIAAAESLGAVDSATAHARRSELAASLDGEGSSEVHSHWKRWMHALINAGGLDAYICQCEEVTKGELLDVSPPRYLEWESEQMSARNLGTLLNDGPVNPDQVKRLTRAGMGHCQGRRCREHVMMLLSEESGTDLTEVPMMSYRPPVRPLSLRVMWPHEETQDTRDNWVSWFRQRRPLSDEEYEDLVEQNKGVIQSQQQG